MSCIKSVKNNLFRTTSQLGDKKDRPCHWVETVDHTQTDSVEVPNQQRHLRSAAPEKNYPVLASSLVKSSFAGVSNDQAASRDLGL